MTKLNKILAVAGVALVLLGLGLGFRGVSVGQTACGSAFMPAAGITPMECDSKLGTSSTVVTVLLVLGGLSLAAAFALKVVKDRRSRVTV